LGPPACAGSPELRAGRRRVGRKLRALAFKLRRVPLYRRLPRLDLSALRVPDLHPEPRSALVKDDRVIVVRSGLQMPGCSSPHAQILWLWATEVGAWTQWRNAGRLGLPSMGPLSRGASAGPPVYSTGFAAGVDDRNASVVVAGGGAERKLVVSLSMTEVERGWVEFVCPSDGFLAAGPPSALVLCACGRKARPERNGVVLRKRDIKALQNEG
jgi:hypothetical protein